MKEFMHHIDYVLMNTVMKECISSPPATDTSVLFYQQNTFNKTLTLPHYQKKENCQRPEKCFPTQAPYGSSTYRTVHATRPLTAVDVKLPSRKMLRQNYTLKLDKRFLRKD